MFSPFSIILHFTVLVPQTLQLLIFISINFLFHLHLSLIHSMFFLQQKGDYSLSPFDFPLLFWWIYYCFWHLCGEFLILSTNFALGCYVLVFRPSFFWIWFNLVWINLILYIKAEVEKKLNPNIKLVFPRRKLKFPLKLLPWR